MRGAPAQVSHMRPLLVGDGGDGERWCQVRLKTAPWATGWRASLDLRLGYDQGLRAGEPRRHPVLQALGCIVRRDAIHYPDPNPGSKQCCSCMIA